MNPVIFIIIAMIPIIMRSRKRSDQADSEDTKVAVNVLFLALILIIPIAFLLFKRVSEPPSLKQLSLQMQIEQLEESYQDLFVERQKDFQELKTANVDESQKEKIVEIEKKFDDTLRHYEEKIKELKNRLKELKSK